MESLPSAREVTMQDRIIVASLADALLEIGSPLACGRLVDCVRCCDEFPECSHTLSWYEATFVTDRGTRIALPVLSEARGRRSFPEGLYVGLFLAGLVYLLVLVAIAVVELL